MENEIKTMKFELNSKQLKYRDILNKEFLELEVWAISDINPNRNISHFTKESMENALSTFKNKPIVGLFQKDDFVDHAGKIDYDNELHKQFWNVESGERILGVIRESDPVELVEKDGLNWIKFRCILWVQYCYKQVRKLLKDRTKKVSVEITIKNSEEDEKGVLQINEFVLNGVTILGTKNGRKVIEAIPDAHLSILEDLEENESFNEQKKMLTFAYQQIDTTDDNQYYNEDKEVKMEMGSIKVNKSKEAMSDKDWGSVDKTALRKKVVEAENFKEIADDIFLDLREGWEEGEVSKLKYPVMEINGDEAVYNRGGLGSAKAYAEKNNETEILSKLKKIYEHLGLNEDEEESYACEDFCDDYEEQKPAEENEAQKCSEEPETDKPKEGEEQCSVVSEEGKCSADDDEHDDHHDDEDDDDCDDCEPEGKPEEECKMSEEEICELKEKCASYEENLCKLQEKCEAYEKELCECREKLEGCKDYEDIKSRLSTAEGKLFDIFCKEMVAAAEEMMAGKMLIDEDKEEIKMKASKGEYASKEEIARAVGYAMFKAAPMGQKEEKKDGGYAAIPVYSPFETTVEPKKEKTRSERLAKYAGIKE
jgi:hypothetical protein